MHGGQGGGRHFKHLSPRSRLGEGSEGTARVEPQGSDRRKKKIGVLQLEQFEEILRQRKGKEKVSFLKQHIKGGGDTEQELNEQKRIGYKHPDKGLAIAK